jgi:hypothetical protein
MKYIWCIDATAIAEFDTFEAAKAALDLEKSTIRVSIGENSFFVAKDAICIMGSEEFDLL